MPQPNRRWTTRVRRVLMNRRRPQGLQRGGGKPGSLFNFMQCALREPEMLQDIRIPLREASPCVLETERLRLRRPTLADVKAIALLANDRRLAENTRRLPPPYLQDH